ncbi:MAG: ECF transporter S component [Alkaliphilus sp.]
MKNKTKKMVLTALLLAITLVFQIGFRAFAQPAVGPLVNMMLILSVLFVGMGGAIVIGALTPIIAFLVGIMPLFPLVPFIAVGNAVLVIVFGLIAKNKDNISMGIGVIVAALAKFAFLAFSVRYLLILFIPKVPQPLVLAMSLPQLYTALAGGVAALIIFKFIPKNTIE